MRKGSKLKVSINSHLFQPEEKKRRSGRVASEENTKESDEISATVHQAKESKKTEKQQLEKITKQVQKETMQPENRKKSPPTTREKKPKKGNAKEQDLADGIMIVKKQNSKLQQMRDNRKGKSVQQLEEEKQKEEEQYRRRKPIVLTVLAIIFVILIYLFFAYGPIFGISLWKEQGLSNDRKIDVATGEDDIYETYHEQLLVYSNQKITTYDNNGHKDWEYSLEENFTPKIYTQGKYMVVSNNTTGKLYLFENKREILNKKIEGSIQNIYLDENGNMAIEYSTTGYKKVIGVYSKSGKNLYNSYLPAGTIIQIALMEDARKLVVFEVDASSFKIGTKVTVIDGTKSQDNMKEIVKLDNNFVYDLTILGQNIIIVLDNKIVSLDINTGNIADIKTFDTAQMIFVGLSSNYATYVEKVLEEGKDTYRIQNVMFDNTVISTQEIDNIPKIMENSGLLNYFVYQDTLQVINKWGVEVKHISLDSPPKDVVVFNKEKAIALIYTNKIYFVNM